MALNQRTMLLPLTFMSRRCLAAAAICVLLVVTFNPLPAVAQYCQPVTPAAPFPIWGVDSMSGRGCGEVGWDSRGMIPWQEFAQGEWVGHARTVQVAVYRLREADQLAVVFRRTRDEISRPYEIQVGDH